MRLIIAGGWFIVLLVIFVLLVIYGLFLATCNNANAQAVPGPNDIKAGTWWVALGRMGATAAVDNANNGPTAQVTLPGCYAKVLSGRSVPSPGVMEVITFNETTRVGPFDTEEAVAAALTKAGWVQYNGWWLAKTGC